MNLRKSGEDYLEAIYMLKSKNGYVRSIDVAHHFEYSKPSVSRAVTNLRGDGYLEMREDGELILTDKGLQVAKNIYERHTVLTSFFEAIGVSRQTAAEDACVVEHAISEETFERLRLLDAGRVAQAMKAKSAGAEGDKADKDKKKKKKGKKKD